MFANPVTGAHAQVPIELGLDSSTRDVIENLPAEVRKQVEQLVRDMLPLIDTSVHSYITHVDKILSDNIDAGIAKLKCAGGGEIEHSKEYLDASIAKYLLINSSNIHTPPGMEHPFQDLDNYINLTRGSFRYTTPPRSIQLSYDDLLYHAALVGCMTGLPGMPDHSEVVAQTRRLYAPALEWSLVIGLPERPTCTSIDGCLRARRKSVQEILNDPVNARDVDAVHAKDLFANIADDPEAPSAVVQTLGRDYIDIGIFEAVLESERQVERLVAAARMQREITASDTYHRADSMLTNGLKLLPPIESQLSAQGPIEDYRKAVPQLEDIVRRVQEADGVADKAAELDPRLGPTVTAFHHQAHVSLQAICTDQKRAIDTVNAHKNPFRPIPDIKANLCAHLG